MPLELDHLILPVNDQPRSVAFSTDVMGFTDDGTRGPGKAVYVMDPDRHLIEIRYYAA